MLGGRTTAAAAWAAACIVAGPALAQQVPATGRPPGSSTPTRPGSASAAASAVAAPGDDRAFLLGLRRMGAVAGRAAACEPEGSRSAVIENAANLGRELAFQFGLNAAFHFIGSVGWGSGHAFDRATCPKVEQEWKALQQKYMGQ